MRLQFLCLDHEEIWSHRTVDILIDACKEHKNQKKASKKHPQMRSKVRRRSQHEDTRRNKNQPSAMYNQKFSDVFTDIWTSTLWPTLSTCCDASSSPAKPTSTPNMIFPYRRKMRARRAQNKRVHVVSRDASVHEKLDKRSHHRPPHQGCLRIRYSLC